MLNKPAPLKLTCDEVAAIERALNTQIKILSMQAGAGLPHALTRLDHAKRTLMRLARCNPCMQMPARRFFRRLPCLFC